MTDRQYFQDKVVVITGASSGIGLACARHFGSLGAKVVMAARRKEKLQEEAPGVSPDPSKVLCVKCDVTVEEDCKALIDAAVEAYGRIDVLVNNAGLSMRAMFKDLDLKVIRSLMDVNFWGTVYCTKYALPFLLESKGSVVGVISIADWLLGFKICREGLPGHHPHRAYEGWPACAGVRPGVHFFQRAERGAYRRRVAAGKHPA